jgi:hypothetical protein
MERNGNMSCTKAHCKNIIPDDDRNAKGEPYRKCQYCRAKDTAATALRRKRQREELGEPPQRVAPHHRDAQEQVLPVAEDNDLRLQQLFGSSDSSLEEPSNPVSSTGNMTSTDIHLPARKEHHCIPDI